MRVRVFQDNDALARAAAAQVADALRHAITSKGRARLLIGADPAQREFLQAVVRAPGVTWAEVELFQLEEYVGASATDRGSMRKYLFEHLIGPARVGRYHLLDAQGDPERAGRVAGEALAAAPVDVAVVGIGTQGQIAANCGPADLASEMPYLVVRLDEACRAERADSFAGMQAADMPERAITVSLRQLISAEKVLAVVSGEAKAEAVKRCCEGTISPLSPATILRKHRDVTLFLDPHAAALLTERPLTE